MGPFVVIWFGLFYTLRTWHSELEFNAYFVVAGNRLFNFICNSIIIASPAGVNNLLYFFYLIQFFFFAQIFVSCLIVNLFLHL